ncbi:MAG: adenine deaminase [Candidatus Omnitrophota bacterium]
MKSFTKPAREIEKISGNIVDVVHSTIYPATVILESGKIKEIVRENKEYNTFIIPGLIDAHVHIESSMLVPSEFARLAVVHGTVSTVSDPHEIANVLGVAGIEYMLSDARKVPFKFYFGAPSCVPATKFETSGAEIDIALLDELLSRPQIKYLSEMMNYPGVINGDPQVLAKIEVAKKYKKPIDGHAPGLRGEALKKYAEAGITTDHETYELEEALEDITLGMKVMIREGSAAKDFNALHTLIAKHPRSVMFCSDDKHPDDLMHGHINQLVKRALDLGYDKMDVLRIASYNPIKHYGLEVGLLQKGDWADFAVIDNFKNFNIIKTYINGRLVAEKGKSFLEKASEGGINNFNAHPKKVSEFAIKAQNSLINVIEVIDGELITRKIKIIPKVSNGYIVSDVEGDILKIAVVNRYREAPVAVGFIKNFGIKKGAIASSVAHDSHNIVAVGASDKDLASAVNLVIHNHGGLALTCGIYKEILKLPVAGLMSNRDGYQIAKKYSELNIAARKLGCNLKAPYMTLSFMALLVEPEIKLSDKGLFDSIYFKFINLFE